MKLFKRLTLAVAALALSHSAFAWNSFGHEAIAYVAEQHLTPKAKEECRRYLNHSLAYYSVWMDHYRNIGIFQPTNFWHGIKTDHMGKIDPAPRGHGQGLIHTERIIKEMKNYKNLPDSTVRQNIIYLVHMIPDFHTPVHINFPRKSFPQYNYSVRNKGKKMSIHSYWDGILNMYRKDWSMLRYYQEVDKLTPKEAKAYIKGAPKKWGEECVEAAHEAYQLTPANMEIGNLPKEEQSHILKYADERALKAAYRLAATLNKIFK